MVLTMGLRRLAEPSCYEETVKKSRFITRLFPVDTPESVKELIESARKTDHDARHHATAMIIGDDASYQRSNDDGEPSGTAGLPMLEVLRRERVTDTLAVVTRSFGGVLLGKAGLIRAYGGGVVGAVAVASFNVKAPFAGLEVRVGAADAGRAVHLLRAFAAGWPGGTVEASYGEEAVFEVWLPPAGEASLRETIGSAPIRTECRAPGTRLVTMSE
jgi:uncharacterized YigZ family protein